MSSTQQLEQESLQYLEAFEFDCEEGARVDRQALSLQEEPSRQRQGARQHSCV
ncbi:MAG TPA: hypothetical protein VIF10_14930 [Methylobacter sp.]|jgi:hypothetical protein